MRSSDWFLRQTVLTCLRWTSCLLNILLHLNHQVCIWCNSSPYLCVGDHILFCVFCDMGVKFDTFLRIWCFGALRTVSSQEAQGAQGCRGVWNKKYWAGSFSNNIWSTCKFFWCWCKGDAPIRGFNAYLGIHKGEPSGGKSTHTPHFQNK